MTTPRRERMSATKAKGRPRRKPKGRHLQSSSPPLIFESQVDSNFGDIVERERDDMIYWYPSRNRRSFRVVNVVGSQTAYMATKTCCAEISMLPRAFSSYPFPNPINHIFFYYPNSSEIYSSHSNTLLNLHQNLFQKSINFHYFYILDIGFLIINWTHKFYLHQPSVLL